MIRRRLAATITAAALGAGGLGAGLVLSIGGQSSAGSLALAPASARASYAYYETVARGLVGGQDGSMMGPSGYAWMMGGARAPGWMMGGSLPASMMGGHDPGTVMGKLFADAPGPRVSASEATRLGNEAPTGATVDATANRITFSGQSVAFAVVASPTMPAEDFRIAGLTDPTVVVPIGAEVRIEFVNADSDMAHGLVVTNQGAESSSMPMMTASPAFSGSALWFLGDSTSAGMHAGTLQFKASTPGTYSYFCPIPGHAQEGMAGRFVVQTAP